MSEQNLLLFHLSLLCLVFSPGTTVSAQLCVLTIPISGACSLLKGPSKPYLQAEKGSVSQHHYTEQKL